MSRPPIGRRSTGPRAFILVLAAGALLGGCGLAASTSAPSAGATLAVPSLSASLSETRRQIAAALAANGLQLEDATRPFRPPATAAFDGVNRAVFQVVLPDDPGHGYIVVYELRDEATAAAAGANLAAYEGSGPGKVQFPPDTQHLIRQVGTTLVTYSWSPANSTDARAPAIFVALGSVGSGFDIPR